LWLVAMQNKDVTEAIQKVAAAYDCKIAEGVLSHQMKQFVIDGNKVVLGASNPETRVDDAEFEENEVYAIDIVTSTGEGKVRGSSDEKYRLLIDLILLKVHILLIDVFHISMKLINGRFLLLFS
jgi:methionine aminopeptidase